MTPRVSVKITSRPAAPKPPVAKPATTKPTSTEELFRRELLRAEREKLERAYFQRVVLPLSAQGYPTPKPQVQLIADRKFAYDYVFVAAKLAVEIQGQIWKKGGHTSGAGITRDAVKTNELACIGWSLLVFTGEQIMSGEALDWTERALRARGFRSTK